MILPEESTRDARHGQAPPPGPDPRSVPSFVEDPGDPGAGAPTRVHLASEPRARLGRAPARPWIGWLVAPFTLVSIVGGVALTRVLPPSLFGIVFGAAVLAGAAWILVSSLHPASADRRCPGCGEESVRRMDPGSTIGLECAACGWRAEEESSFLLAEDEGAALEELVLRERRRPRRPPPRA